jgi:hypothetical protein
VRRVYRYTTTQTFDRNPAQERLLGAITTEEYLALRNAFNSIMANTLPEVLHKGLDALLLTQAPQERVSRVLGGWPSPWKLSSKG